MSKHVIEAVTDLKTKTYDHSLGLSTTFRQWRAESHCRFLHTYHMRFDIDYVGEFHTRHNDFIMSFKNSLVVAENDPQRDYIMRTFGRGVAAGHIVDATGCECLSRHVYNTLEHMGLDVRRVTIYEHDTNYASYSNWVGEPRYTCGKVYQPNQGFTSTWFENGVLHGGALRISVEFAAEELDVRNFVVDFGSMKSFQQQLVDTFDHKLLVTEDDVSSGMTNYVETFGIGDVVIVPETGCKSFAKLVFEGADIWLGDAGYKPRCTVSRVEVREQVGDKNHVHFRKTPPQVDFIPKK